MDAAVLTARDLLRLEEPAAQTRIALSPDARWVACEVRRRFGGGDEGVDEPPDREVRLFDLREAAGPGTPALARPARSWRPAWGPATDPAGEAAPWRLAFYGAEAGAADAGLYVWEGGAARRLGTAAARPRWFPADRPWWAPDGRSLIATLWPAAAGPAPPRGWPAPADIEVYRTGADSPPAAVAPGRDPWWPLRADVGVIDRESGAVLGRLLPGAALLWTQPSPDWRWLAAHTAGDARRTELWLVPLDGGEAVPRLVADDLESSGSLRHTPAWSPDGRHLAWVGQGRPRLLAVDHPEEGPRPLAVPDGLRCSERYLTWTPDGAHLVAWDGNRFWALPVSGAGGRALPGQADAEVPYQPLQRGGDTWVSSPDGRALVLPTTPRGSSRRRVWAIPWCGDGAPVLLRDAAKHLQFQSPSPIGDGFADVTPDGRTAVYAAGEATRPLDLHRLDLASPASGTGAARDTPVSRLNPHLEARAWGRVHVLRYRSPRGRELGAVLLTPPGVEAPRPLPLAVFVYPGGIPPTGEVHRFVPEIDMVVSAHLLAARGFAVLRPDMPWPAEPRHSPLRAIASLVLPAVDAAVAAGWADAGRVAAVGQSYGGYAVLALLVGTDRFRAGVASSPVADLISFYGEGRLRPGGVVEPSWQDWAESGQGEMGAPPWEQPERYVANSPVFHLPRVGAPLLLLAGGRSPADLRQSVEVFCGLRRLGKTAELVTYAGGRHLPHAAEARSFRDAADRVCGWLDMHLR